MLVLLTKANHDIWHKYKEFNTIEELFEYINYCHHDLILQDNFFYKSIDTREEEQCGLFPGELAKIWNTTIEDAYKINDIRWEVVIYNSYVE